MQQIERVQVPSRVLSELCVPRSRVIRPRDVSEARAVVSVYQMVCAAQRDQSRLARVSDCQRCVNVRPQEAPAQDRRCVSVCPQEARDVSPQEAPAQDRICEICEPTGGPRTGREYGLSPQEADVLRPQEAIETEAASVTPAVTLSQVTMLMQAKMAGCALAQIELAQEFSRNGTTIRP